MMNMSDLLKLFVLDVSVAVEVEHLERNLKHPRRRCHTDEHTSPTHVTPTENMSRLNNAPNHVGAVQLASD